MKYVEFGGGLGDVINSCYRFGEYLHLSTVTEKTMVVLVCHNIFTREIFTQHPNFNNFILNEPGYMLPQSARPFYADLAKSGHTKFHCTSSGPVTFYPNEEDLKIIRAVQSNGRYAVVQPYAGMTERNLPIPHVGAIQQHMITLGLPLYVIGRNYNRIAHSNETMAVLNSNTTSLIDRLSVPGTIELIKGASVFVGAHSSMSIVAWHNRVPNYILYPKSIEEAMFGSNNEWNFGASYPESRKDLFENISLEKIQQVCRR